MKLIEISENIFINPHYVTRVSSTTNMLYHYEIDIYSCTDDPCAIKVASKNELATELKRIVDLINAELDKEQSK